MEIAQLDPPLRDFYAKALDVRGTTVRAHADVADEALLEAGRRIDRLLQASPTLAANLASAGAKMHVIGCRQKVTDLPMYRHMAGKKRDDGLTMDERARGYVSRPSRAPRPPSRQTPAHYAGPQLGCKPKTAAGKAAAKKLAKLHRQLPSEYHSLDINGIRSICLKAANERRTHSLIPTLKEMDKHWRVVLGDTSKSYQRNKRTHCEVCGFHTNLKVHHIDQDHGNDRKSDLQTVCGNCHTAHHAWATKRGIYPAGRVVAH